MKKIFNGATHEVSLLFKMETPLPLHFRTLRLKLIDSSIPLVALFIRLSDAGRSDEESAEKAA